MGGGNSRRRCRDEFWETRTTKKKFGAAIAPIRKVNNQITKISESPESTRFCHLVNGTVRKLSLQAVSKLGLSHLIPHIHQVLPHLL